MDARDFAAVLKRKALQDVFTVEKLIGDPASPDEVLGFHAQQAVEKLLKAVLAAHSVPFRRTHDLVELIDLIRANGIAFPGELEEVRRLGPFAAELRYDDLPAEDERPIDRAWLMDCVQRTRGWAEPFLPE